MADEYCDNCGDPVDLHKDGHCLVQGCGCEQLYYNYGFDDAWQARDAARDETDMNEEAKREAAFEKEFGYGIDSTAWGGQPEERRFIAGFDAGWQARGRDPKLDVDRYEM